MNIQFTTEYRIRLAAAAEDQAMSVEEFVLDALERVLCPIESRRSGAARDILELEALWRSAGDPAEGGEKKAPPIQPG